jgi:RHS repeat-associated protein
MVAGSLVAAPVASADPPSGDVTFTYTGAAQSWTVPAGVTAVSVDVFGAQGGSATYGGPGGRVRGTLAVTPGEVLQINVGGQGGAGGAGSGGFNGGGPGWVNAFGGGGASDIRRGGVTLTHRTVVAGGGGGAGELAGPINGAGGAGGGATGTAGLGACGATPGSGASQLAGGAGGTGPRGNGGAGSLGTGGTASAGNGPADEQGGGGGGGYYGGGGAAAGDCSDNGPGAGGGGGSSWAAPTVSGARLDRAARLGHGQVTIAWPPATPAPATAQPGSASFSYTGTAEWFTVPAGVHAVAVDLYGAQGGHGGRGGPGGRVRATVPVVPGEILQVNVGGQGGVGGGGFNGGGNATSGGHGGGGASDLRRGTTLADRIVVAAGGGGAGELPGPLYGAGGAGGGPTGSAGQNACGANPGLGGSPSAGGAGGTGPRGNGGTGGPGTGGVAAAGNTGTDEQGGGGGGGWYGGGGAGAGDCTDAGPGAGGGGGSSWTLPAAAAVRDEPGVRLGHGQVAISWPPVSPTPVAPTAGSLTYGFSGSPEWFTVPAGVHAIAVDLYGAQGGHATLGGLGGRVSATVAVSPGDVLQVNVGGQGAVGAGGFNGGGFGPPGAHGGGGASDVRRNGGTVASRVVVAGGGGGAGEWSGVTAGGGGAGGGWTGGPGVAACWGNPGSGGTQSGGGAGGTGDRSGAAGTLAEGGTGSAGRYGSREQGGGGGGGYYGGGGGGGGDCNEDPGAGPGGGGGSSWVSPVLGSDAATASGVRSGNGQVTISWPVPRDASKAFGNDSYGEFVNNVHLGSGNLVESVTDVEVATAGPDLELSRTYNSLDSRVGWFGTGWSSTYEISASADPVSGDVTIIYADGRRERHVRQADGSFVGPLGFVSKLTTRVGGGWDLTHKDRSVKTFDSAGKLTALVDRYGRSLTFVYSGSQLASVTDSLSGRSLTFTWASGKIETVSTSSVSGPGYSGPLTWRYVYSGDLLTKVCDATDNDPVAGSCTVYAYTGGRLGSVTRSEGNQALEVAYQADGKVDWTENGVNDRVQYDYWDGVSAVTDARGYVAYYFFDPSWRTTMMIDPAGGITTYGYDAGGFRSKVTDPNGNTASMGYDARGNLVSQTDGEGATTWMAYDANDNLTARRDARSASSTDNTYKTTFTYNSFGDKLTETSPVTAEQPSGVTKTWTYTAGGENFGFGAVPAGLLRSSSDGVGTTWFSYDPDGDLRSTTTPSGLVRSQDTDSLGRVVSLTETWDSTSATTTTEFDELGQPVKVLEPAVDDTTVSPAVTRRKQTVTDYDANGNPWRMTVSDVGGSAVPTPTRVTTVDFDAADRAWRTTDAEGGVTSKTFDANGNVVTVTDAEGRVHRTDYDERNRPVQVTLLGFVDDPIGASTPRDVVLSRTEYDQAGRVVASYLPRPSTGGLTGQLSPSSTPMAKQRIVHDRADRPLSVTFEAYQDRTGGTRDIVLSARTYDQAGNVLTETSGGGARVVTNLYDAAGLLQTSTLEMGVDDQVTEVDYDPASRPTRQRVTRGSSIVETHTAYNTSGWPTAQTVENGADDLVTTFGYDARGARTWTVDPRGNASGAVAADFRTDSAYDLLGRLVESQAPPVSIEAVGGTAVSGRPTVRYGYDAIGNRTGTVDPRGAVTRATFDRLDRMTRIDHPEYTPPGGSLLAPYETFSYDDVGNLVSRRDRRGQVTDFVFDARNRAVRQIDPLVTGQAARGYTVTTWDDAGGQHSVTDPTGAVVRVGYDDLGRPRTRTQEVRQNNNASYPSTSDYDDLGNQTYMSDPTGIVTTTAFDQAGRPISVTDALGKQTIFGYDAAGRRTSEVDPLGRRTEHVFDQAGRETSTLWKAAGTGAVLATEYRTFDPVGNQTAHRSARSASAVDDTFKTGYVYDALSRLVQVSQPDAAGPMVTSYGYDAAGNVTRVTDGNGNVTTSTWTPWNTTESTVEPATPGQTALADRSFSVTVDAAGLPITEAQPGVTVSRTFDELGRLTAESGTGTGIPSASRSFGYDLAGRRTSISHPDGTVSLAYDDRGLLLSAGVPGGGAAQSTFGYDAAGRMTSRTDAAGTTTYTYTGRGELDVAADPLTASTTNFDWNDAGQPSAVTYGTIPSATTRAYGYDARGRLDTDTLTVGGTTLAAADYDYDADNNVVAQTITAPGNTAAGAHVYAYDRSGRLDSWTAPGPVVTDYGYDPAGNRTLAGGVTSMFDARNRLLSDGTTTYQWSARGTLEETVAGSVTTDVVFDALGRQTAVGTVDYLYDALDRITEREGVDFTYGGLEIDPAAVGGELLARSPAGELLAVGSGTTGAFAGENRHGDLAWLLGTNGTVTDTRIWDPYGQAAGVTGTTNPSVGYQGDYTDPTTGDVWMGARWYQPNTGTFTARDTVFGMLRTPVTLNRYTYANGDPLEHFDPDGRFSLKVLGEWRQKLGFGGRTAKTEAGPASPRAASSESAKAKKATAERARQEDDMKKYLKKKGALPANWDDASSEARTGYYMWAILANGNQTNLSQQQFGKLSADKKNALWKNKAEAAFKDIQCDSARSRWVCERKAGLTQIGLSLLNVSIGLATGGVATSALKGAGLTGTKAVVAAAGIGGFSGSAATQYAATGNISLGSATRDGLLSAATSGVLNKFSTLAKGTRAPVAASQTGPRRPDFVAGPIGSEPPVPVSQSRMAAGFDDAGFPRQPTASPGMEYTLPDGSKARLMAPSGPAPLRASFTNANGQPINPFTGKPVQPPAPPGWSMKDWVRELTHVEQTP